MITPAYQESAHARDLPTLIDRFSPIGLDEMDSVALLNRVDIKFVLTPEQVFQALSAVGSDYRVLTIKGVRMNHYYTVYYDTADFFFYHQHHNEGQNRFKVRFRTYLESHLSFLEVKNKTNKGRTVKSRMKVPDIVPHFEPAMDIFLRKRLDVDTNQLHAQLTNRFTRMTLVSEEHQERLTIDMGISFEGGGTNLQIPNLVVAEVKQDGHNRYSPFLLQMRKLHAYKMSFSKYCVGAAMLYPHLKQNNFKRIFLQMQKMNAYPTLRSNRSYAVEPQYQRNNMLPEHVGPLAFA
jgi:hypothetical protein